MKRKWIAFSKIIKRLLKIENTSARIENHHSGEEIGKVIKKVEDDRGVAVSVAMKDLPEDPIMRAILEGKGLQPIRIGIDMGGEKDSFYTAAINEFYADNMWNECGIPLNEIRKIKGKKQIPPTTDTNVTKAHRKRCEYCGCISNRDYGTCEHCGAPLP